MPTTPAADPAAGGHGPSPSTAPAPGAARSTAQVPSPPRGTPDLIRHYINGAARESATGETFDVLDPTTNATYVRAAAGQGADIDAAVASARAAFEEGPWPRMKNRERARVLNRIADAVQDQDQALAAMESFDTGLPITQARGQARRAAENFRFFADLIEIGRASCRERTLIG